jgi:serine/threonine-protein kinase HipA
MNARSLRASINQTEVGTLQEVARLWRFQYAAEWLGNPHCFALSPHLQLNNEDRATMGEIGCQSGSEAHIYFPNGK